MQLSDAIAQYKIDYPYQKIRTKSLPDSISLDDEASCFEELANLLLPDGIISGLGVAVDGSNNLTVQPGVWQIQRLQYSTSTVTTFALDAQDPTLSRYDVVYADAFNRLYLLSGDLSSSPVIPAIPGSTILICTALITPTSVTIGSPPPIDYVDTHSDQTINGIKTFTSSPQVPNGVTGQDAVAFNQLADFITGEQFNNGIGVTSFPYYGLGGQLSMNTTIDMNSFTLKFTQGLLFLDDYSSYFDANDRAIIDAGYFRNNQWYHPWVSGQNLVTGNIVSDGSLLFLTNNPITNSTETPYRALRTIQFTSAVSDANNITSYLDWVNISNTFSPVGDGILYLEVSFSTTNNSTFPLFSLVQSIFGEDWVGFSIGVDNNTINQGYFAEYKFTPSQIATAGVWYELLPLYKSHDYISRSGRSHELHIDVAKNASGAYEVRGRHKLLSGAVSFQDYSIEILKSKSRQFFTLPQVSPSLYWNILNNGTNPNTQLPNWKGTDSGIPTIIQGATIGIGPFTSYAVQTAGLDNYVSDVSGSFTGLSKINKAYADATYLTSTSLSGYLLKSGGTMTGVLNLAADPTADAQAANKHYVDAAILAKAAYFAAGTFKPAGPNFGDDPGTINNPWEYGDIVADSITTNTTGASFNQTTTNANVTTFKYNGANVGFVTFDGYYRGAGIYSLSGLANGFVSLSASGTVIGRNVGDAVSALKIQQSNLSSTGFILELQNQYRDIFTIGVDGSIVHNGLSKSVSTTAIGYNMVSGLRPSANGDVLVGLAINPTFGKSKIATLTVGSLVGGSGYPTGTFLSNVTGGTGRNAVLQVVCSGGSVTSATLIDGGINYTAGDVLGIVVLVGGSPVGSGATVPVGSITTYTGLQNYSLSVLGGPSLFAASTSAYGSLIITPGAAYTGATNGTLWFDGTNFKAIVGGVVKTFTLT
jgi:hypothetical protein